MMTIDITAENTNDTDRSRSYRGGDRAVSPNDVPTSVVSTRIVVKFLAGTLTIVAGAFAALIIWIAQGVLQDVKDNGEKLDRALIAIAGNQNDIKYILRYLGLVKLDVESEMRAAFIVGQPFESTDDGGGKKYVRVAGVYDATTATMAIFRSVRGVNDRDEHIERAVATLHFLTNRLVSFSDIENEPTSEPGDIPRLDGKQIQKLYSYVFPSLRCSDNVPGCGINVSEVHAALLRQGWKKGATVPVNGSETYRALAKEISGNSDFLETAELM